MNPVDPQKAPRLHAALERSRAQAREGWEKVAELRRQNDTDAANRLARKLLGVKRPPMSEEKKAELKAWKEEHKEEIQEKKQQEREMDRRVKELMRPRKRK